MPNSRRKGFTIVEIMIAVVIFLLIIVGLFAVLTTGRGFWRVSDAQVELQDELRKAMQWVSDELREGATHTVQGVPADDNWYNSITFQVPSDTQSGYSLQLDPQEIQYALGGINNQQLLRTAADVRILANNISSFLVRRQSATPRIVEIELQAQVTNATGVILDDSLTFQVKLRN